LRGVPDEPVQPPLLGHAVRAPLQPDVGRARRDRRPGGADRREHRLADLLPADARHGDPGAPPPPGPGAVGRAPPARVRGAHRAGAGAVRGDPRAGGGRGGGGTMRALASAGALALALAGCAPPPAAPAPRTGTLPPIPARSGPLRIDLVYPAEGAVL